MIDKKTYMRDYMRHRRSRLRAEGRCLMCGQVPEPGRKTCRDCLRKQRAASARYYAEKTGRATA